MPSYVRAGIRKCARIRALSQMQNIHRDINSAPRVGEAPQAD